jgi:membrane fusion protein, multidrug efflux system
MKKRFVGWSLLLLLAACDKPAPTEAPPRPALVRVVGEKSAASTMALVGEVRPRYESSQGFRIDGKIIERKVEVGSLVKKGQLIARLDPADSHLNVAAAQASVSAAEAESALALAELNRQRQLFAKKFISASALDVREAQYKTANARLAQVKAQAYVSDNQAQYTQLTADRDGVVTYVHAEPGQVIESGEVIVKIADTRAIDVLVAVPESRMAEVKLNAPVIIKLWSDRQKSYRGVVREMSPAAESATRAFNVRITVTQPDVAFKLGITTGVKFTLDDAQSASGYLIPSKALTEINGQTLVWVVDANNQVQPRSVVAGPFREDGVLIIEGLQAGEKVAIAGVHTLVKDQRVKPVIEAAP